MADHSKPVLTSTYANFVTELDARFDDLAVGLDPAFSTPTNLPNNSIRWSSASNKWEKWNLTVWSPLSTGYDIDIANGSITNSPISGSSGSFTSLVASGAFSLTGDQVQVSEGGTGATTAATARANLGAAPTASPAFTGPVSVNDGLGEGQILVGANDGYFYANANACGWYSPTLGSFAYNFSDDQFYINGQKAWRQGNDGAGSGLDADLLDGQQGNYYAPVLNPTFSGSLSVVTEGSEGRIFAGLTDGYFYANLTAAGWHSPTLGSLDYSFSDDQLYINGKKAWNQGNAGAGSGLDADLLDGQQGSYYKGVGLGQVWHNVTGSRSLGVTYYNATAQPMQVHITTGSTDINHIGTLTVGGVLVGRATQPTGGFAIIHAAVIPPGASYVVAQNGPNAGISNWAELY